MLLDRLRDGRWQGGEVKLMGSLGGEPSPAPMARWSLLTHRGARSFLLILFLQHVCPGLGHQLPQRPLVGDARHEGVLRRSRG